MSAKSREAEDVKEAEESDPTADSLLQAPGSGGSRVTEDGGKVEDVSHSSHDPKSPSDAPSDAASCKKTKRSILEIVASGDTDSLTEALSEMKKDSVPQETLQSQLNYSLLQAVLGHSKEMAALLIEAGASCNAFSDSCPLVNAAASLEDESVVELLLDQDVTLGSPNLAHVIARTGNLGLAKKAITADTDLSVTDSMGRTPLHVAVECGQEEIVRYFLSESCKCDVNSQNSTGMNAVHLAAREGHAKILRLLLEKGATDSPADDDGYTPWMYAVTNKKHDVAKVLEESLSLDVPVTDTGNTLLHQAAATGDVACTQRLLEMKPNVNLQNNYERTPLMFAVTSQYWQICDCLVKAEGCCLDVKTDRGYTALGIALEEDFTPCMRHILDTLVSHGALVNEVESGMESYLMKYLLKPISQLGKAKWLLDALADPDYDIDGERSVLIDVAYNGSVERLQLLLEANVDMLKSDRLDDYGRTALEAAIRQGSSCHEVGMMLLKLGCSMHNMEDWAESDRADDLRRGDPQEAQLYRKIIWRVNHPLSLLELSRLHVLSNLKREGSLKSRLQRLNIPALLKKYLHWEGFLEEYETPRVSRSVSRMSEDSQASSQAH